MPLASCQLDLSSLLPGFSSADAGVVKIARLAAASTASPQRVECDHCIRYPPQVRVKLSLVSGPLRFYVLAGGPRYEQVVLDTKHPPTSATTLTVRGLFLPF